MKTNEERTICIDGYWIEVHEADSKLEAIRNQSRSVHVYKESHGYKRFIGTYSNNGWYNGWYGGYIPDSVKEACKSLLLMEEL
jgi:hypothetical protein